MVFPRLSPFLKKSVTFAVCKSSGAFPSHHSLAKIIKRDLAMAWDSSLSVCGYVSSGSLDKSNLFKAFLTRSSPIKGTITSLFTFPQSQGLVLPED